MKIDMLKIIVLLCLIVIHVQADLIVNTKYGSIKAKTAVSSRNHPGYIFHRVPFAKPPLGHLRFMDPTPPDSWDEIRDGTLEPVMCSHPFLLRYMADSSEIFRGQEDCLYMSIYIPKVEPLRNLPVMVFFHGGAFMGGSAALYSGENFMNENVILVIPNYRLGILGFLTTEDDVISGNFGLKDQNMALNWIQENIAAFGGDPDKVTIFGESAGGASVHLHMLSPYSKGLFARAIIQSGTALCPWTQSVNQKGIATKVGASVGCLYDESINNKAATQMFLECLQSIEAETLTMKFSDYMKWTFLPVNFGPYVDNDFIPNNPELLVVSGNYTDVDLMIGVNAHEGAFVTASILANENARELFSADKETYAPISLGFENENSKYELSKTAYEYYIRDISVDNQHAHKLVELYGDHHFGVCSDIVAINHGKQSTKSTYVYEFNYRGKKSLSDLFGVGNISKNWVAHSDELEYLVPGLVSSTSKNSQVSTEDLKMANIMTKLWTNFAETGNPTPNDSLNFKWSKFTAKSQKYLEISSDSKMKKDKREQIRKFWQSLDTRQNSLLATEAKTEAHSEL